LTPRAAASALATLLTVALAMAPLSAALLALVRLAASRVAAPLAVWL